MARWWHKNAWRWAIRSWNSSIQVSEPFLTLLNYREDVHKEWEILREIAAKYPEHFPKEYVTDENLNWWSNFVMTRGFGIGLNFTLIVPFADCFNHYNMDTGTELFCPKLHKVSKYDLKLYNNGKSTFCLLIQSRCERVPDKRANDSSLQRLLW